MLQFSIPAIARLLLFHFNLLCYLKLTKPLTHRESPPSQFCRNIFNVFKEDNLNVNKSKGLIIFFNYYFFDQTLPNINTNRLLPYAKTLVFVRLKLCILSGSATYATAPLSIVKLYYSCLLSQFSLGSGLEEKPKFYGYTKLINLMFPQRIFKFPWSVSTVWKIDILVIKVTEF